MPLKSSMASIPSCSSALALSRTSTPTCSSIGRRNHSIILCQSPTDISALQKTNNSWFDGLSEIKAPRRAVTLSLSCVTLAGLAFPLVSFPAFGILEPDDDVDLMEKFKAGRKKRLGQKDKIKILKSEAAYVQEAVYKLSEVGQAIENNDFTRAIGVLGNSLDTKWIVDVSEAFLKVSSDPEQKSKAETFTASLATLISAVSKENLDLSKSAFVSSADALEDWSALTGLSEQLKGL